VFSSSVPNKFFSFVAVIIVHLKKSHKTPTHSLINSQQHPHTHSHALAAPPATPTQTDEGLGEGRIQRFSFGYAL